MPRHLFETVVTKTSDYTAAITDSVIACTGTLTVTLPAVSGIGGRIYHIKNTGTGIVTVDGNSSETIDDELTVDLIPDENLTVATDGSEWYIL